MTPVLSEYFVPVLPEGFGVERDGRFRILLHPDNPSWMLIDEVGYEVVRLCKGNNTVGQIASILSSQYQQSYSSVLLDVAGFVEQLQRANMLGEESVKECETHVKIKRVHLNVTEKCNLRCVHCGVAGGYAKNDDLSTQEIFNLIDALVENGGEYIAISGGEPLLREDCVDIVQYAASRLNTVLATNLTLLSRETADALSPLDITFQVSIDGSVPEIHDMIRGNGSFQKTLNGINLLKERGCADKILLNVALTRKNIKDIPKLVKFVENLGIKALRLLPLQRMGMAKSEWSSLNPEEEYEELYAWVCENKCKVKIEPGVTGFYLKLSGEDRNTCRIGHNLMISSNGDLYPCPLLSSFPEFFLGNIKERSIKELERLPKLKAARNKCIHRENLIEKCKVCPWRNLCQGGCPGTVLLEKGTMYGTDNLCEIRKQLYRKKIFALATRTGEK